jgi:hypothetical protein
LNALVVSDRDDEALACIEHRAWLATVRDEGEQPPPHRSTGCSLLSRTRLSNALASACAAVALREEQAPAPGAGHALAPDEFEARRPTIGHAGFRQ